MLQSAAKQLGLELSDADVDRMMRLLDELDDWNQRMNLLTGESKYVDVL